MYLGTDRGLLAVTDRARPTLDERVECVLVPGAGADEDAADDRAGETVLVGTDAGLYRASGVDPAAPPAPAEWTRVLGEWTTALAGRAGLLWAGTEPSALYRSTGGGHTWTGRPGLTDLPSAGEWSFPPRPDSHHVRWIAVDPRDSRRLLLAIEAGAVVRTADGGASWRDRTPGGPRDAHTLAVHPEAPDRVYAAAGDGYFESPDGGDSWSRPREGLAHGYVWGLAVDPGDPDRRLVSAAAGAHRAHRPDSAESHVYRRVGDRWERVEHSALSGTGVTRAVFATDGPGVVHAATNRGLVRSTDFGATWREHDLDWDGPPGVVRALAV